MKISGEDYVEIEQGNEYHFDTGEVWTGILIQSIPKNAERPASCEFCDKWFLKSDKVHKVRNRYVFHEVEGHYVAGGLTGSICEDCFSKIEVRFKGSIIRR